MQSTCYVVISVVNVLLVKITETKLQTKHFIHSTIRSLPKCTLVVCVLLKFFISNFCYEKNLESIHIKQLQKMVLSLKPKTLILLLYRVFIKFLLIE